MLANGSDIINPINIGMADNKIISVRTKFPVPKVRQWDYR